MVQQIAEVSRQDWIDAFSEYGIAIYPKEIDTPMFSLRGTRVIENPKYYLLKTEALLFEILDWVGEIDPQGKVEKLYQFLENRGLIDTDGKVVRWKQKPVTVVDSRQDFD